MPKTGGSVTARIAAASQTRAATPDCAGAAFLINGCAPKVVAGQYAAIECAAYGGLIAGCGGSPPPPAPPEALATFKPLGNAADASDGGSVSIGVFVGVLIGCIVFTALVSALVTFLFIRSMMNSDNPSAAGIKRAMSAGKMSVKHQPSFTFKREEADAASASTVEAI